jgi:archaellum biogenesis protein FlaJ (TadC family)
MSRKKYINAYETVYEYDEKGRETRKLQYLGQYFKVMLDEAALKRYKLSQILSFLLILLIQAGLGFLNNAGGRVLYVSLPYVAVFFPLLYWAVAAIRLPSKQQEFRLEVIGLSFDRVKLTSLLVAVFAAIASLGLIVFLIFFRPANYLLDLLFLIGELIVFTIALLARLKSQKIEIRVIEEPLKQ